VFQASCLKFNIGDIEVFLVKSNNNEFLKLSINLFDFSEITSRPEVWNAHN
jgi:hypothetical protein